MSWWSWFLTAFGVIVMLLAAKDRRGWLLGIVWEVLWAIYGFTSQQWGFVASAGIFTAVFVGNYLGFDVFDWTWSLWRRRSMPQ